MGDVIHNLPVVTDIRDRFPEAIIDWVVEEAFADIPRLHRGVRKVIPVAVRRWRRSLIDAVTHRQIRAFKAAIKSETYDFVLDTQGLIKSALTARLARGQRCGYAWNSAREPLASCFYHRRFAVDKNLHAVARNRLLAAQALGYDLTSVPADYGLTAAAGESSQAAYAVLIHSTSRANKLWSEENWSALGQLFHQAGLVCYLPWGSPDEKQRSERLAHAIPGAQVPAALTLSQAATLLAAAEVVVGVDTGLAHLAAALGTKVVALYAGSAPALTGVYGRNAVNLGGQARPPAVMEVWQAVASFPDSRPR